MELPTKKSSGKPKLRLIRLLIYGLPGVGKSTLLMGFPEIAVMFTEKNNERMKVYSIPIQSWEDFLEAVRKLERKGEELYQTLGIDTVDILFNHCVDYVCRKLQISHPQDAGYGKGYDLIRKEFERELNKLFFLDIGIVMVSHMREQDFITRGGKFTKIVPKLANAARDIIVPKVSTVGYMHVTRIKTDEGKVYARIMDFSVTDEVEAKDNTGMLPPQLRMFKDPKRSYEQFVAAYREKGGVVD